MQLARLARRSEGAEERLRALAAKFFRDRGYKVLESRSPEGALEISERYKEPIDMLLTDVVMPRMSGPDLAQRLAFSLPSMKVLRALGNTNVAVIRNGVLEPGAAFLQKPSLLRL